jgi:hypothetical protein
VTDLEGLIWILAGIGGLGVAAGLAACCLRLRSPLEFVVAAYILAWAWLVALTLALSPVRLLTHAWLVVGVGVGVVAAVAAWAAAGRPQPPPFRPASDSVLAALRNPAILILAVAVSLGAAYSVALALFTPVNEGDALAYHLARAAFWKQEHGIGYVANAVDVRLNANPPNAEIGQLATMLLSGSDRYVALPQLAAYGVLVLCVAGIARRIGLEAPEALFGALAFATLPVVALQASGALNDLVVASFLAAGVLFALRAGRASLSLLALALGLALGTKLTAVLALPTFALVTAMGRPRREWLGVALAGLAGIVLGSTWYVVNLVETGELDGGLAEAFDQRVDVSFPVVVVNALRLVLDAVDMSGAARPHSAVFPAAAGVLAVLALLRARRSRRQALALFLASAVTASPFFAATVVDLGQRAVFKAWVVLDRPETPPFDDDWELNVDADPVDSWYGPLGALLLVTGPLAIAVLRRRKPLPIVSFGLALAPWALLLTLAATIVWDPWRGRFLVFGVALAAATWGLLLRSRIAAAATAAIGATALALSLANYQGKPTGLGDLWASGDPPPPSVETIWNERRSDAQARLRPRQGEGAVLRYVDDSVPTDAALAVVVRENDFLSPYFGDRFSRHVSLVSPDGGVVPPDAEWLVIAPSTRVRRCTDAWRQEFAHEKGWSIERRIAPDECPALRRGS